MGGTETLLMSIYRELDRSQTQFDFLVYDIAPAFYDDEVVAVGGHIIPVALKKRFGVLRTLLEMIRTMRAGHYGAVHAHVSYNSGLVMLAAVLANVPIRIVHSHTTAYNKRMTWRRSVYQVAMRILIDQCANRFCACSVRAAEFLFTPHTVATRCQIVPNAVDFEPFFVTPGAEIAELRAELRLPADACVIGHVGRFGAAKNHEFLVEVFARVAVQREDCFLLLVGGGDDTVLASVKARATSLGLDERVRFTGVRTDVPRLMGIMDVFLLPSLYEGFGLVLLEAQASGLRCLVSEAIQPEVDVGLGLLWRLDLDTGADAWAEKAMGLMRLGKIDTAANATKLRESPFSIRNAVGEFLDLYREGRSGADA